MSKVKVMVGQSWVNKEISTYSVEVKELFPQRIKTDSAFFGWEEFYKKFTFAPANDLEWLAIKCDKWCDNDLGNKNIARRGEEFVFGDYRYLDKSYQMQAWFNKRVHLGLETDEVTTEEIDMLTKEDKPVYTIEMVNNVTPPQVLSRVIVAASYDELGERLGSFAGKEVDIIASTPFNGGTVLTVSHYMNGIAAMNMVSGLFIPIDTRTDQEKLVDDLNDFILSNRELMAEKLTSKLIESFNITRKES